MGLRKPQQPLVASQALWLCALSRQGPVWGSHVLAGGRGRTPISPRAASGALRTVSTV